MQKVVLLFADGEEWSKRTGVEKLCRDAVPNNDRYVNEEET